MGNYELLIDAIIKQAISDYISYEYEIKMGIDVRQNNQEQLKIEYFIGSKYFKNLTNRSGNLMLKF